MTVLTAEDIVRREWLICSKRRSEFIGKYYECIFSELKRRK